MKIQVLNDVDELIWEREQKGAMTMEVYRAMLQSKKRDTVISPGESAAVVGKSYTAVLA